MFLAILNAAFIYGLIWMFERKRRELHEFDFDIIGGRPSYLSRERPRIAWPY
jgi:hypothetical protein